MAQKEIIKALKKAAGVKKIHLETPEILEHGDYATNVALKLKSKNAKGKSTSQKFKVERYKLPRELAEDIVKKLSVDSSLKAVVDRIEVAGPGFINFWLSEKYLQDNLKLVLTQKEKYGDLNILKGKNIMVEYGHPNTHKEMHIGHLRTLIVGESLARIFDAAGAKVFRANYQGDIGPHVAKAIWGTEKILKEEKSSWDEYEKMDLSDRAHLLGRGYARGNSDYKDHEDEIDQLNIKLYKKDKGVSEVYNRTRKWSLDYYDRFYRRFYTSYDRLYFESEVFEPGKKIVEANMGKVFEKSEGAVIFDGEKYGFHKRVFITKNGTPTYEAKETALVPLQYSDFPFDLNVHVVASEQTGYFEVVFKAVEVIDKKFKGKLYHLKMGMVNFIGRKISSRRGDVITVDELLDNVKKEIAKLTPGVGMSKSELEEIIEMVTVAAVKYSVLSTGAKSDVAFDIKRSMSLDGNSGPYLQYTYARTQSVLRKSQVTNSKLQTNFKLQILNYKLNAEELALLRSFVHFQGVLEDVAKNYSPNLLCNYLFDLAQKYNNFYAKHKILGTRQEAPGNSKKNSKLATTNFRLALTKATSQILSNGLDLLGIQTPGRM